MPSRKPIVRVASQLRPVVQALTKRRPFPYDFAGRCEYAGDSPHAKPTRRSPGNFAGQGKVKATVATDRLESINQIFSRMRAGDIQGRTVIDIQK